MNELSAVLAATLSLSPGDIQNATGRLETLSKTEQFFSDLLTILHHESTDIGVRQAGAIYLKNIIKRLWDVDISQGGLSAANRLLIKEQLPRLILNPACPNNVSTQLNEALRYICATDFPSEYPQLLPYIINTAFYGERIDIETLRHVQMSDCKCHPQLPGDILSRPLGSYISVLSILHSILKRYRNLMRENHVLAAIQYTLPFVQSIVHALLKRCVQQLRSNTSDAETQVCLNVLTLVVKIFWSLNAVDLPEFFEDHMHDTFSCFIILIGLPHPQSDDDEHPGVVENLKASICSSMLLYTDKYQEEVQPYVPSCIQAVWEMLRHLDHKHKYDSLVAAGIDFLCSCLRTRWQPQALPPAFASTLGIPANNAPVLPFDDVNTLKEMIRIIIVENMTLKAGDTENMVDNGLEYMRIELGGEAFNSRRGCALEFAKTLCKFYERQLTDILQECICIILEKAKAAGNGTTYEGSVYVDAATCLLTCIYIKSTFQSTPNFRATDLMKPEDVTVICNFINTHLLPELQRPDMRAHLITKVAAIKFISAFRSQIDQQTLGVVLPLVIQHVGAQEAALHTVCAFCIERLLSARVPQTKAYYVDGPQLQPLLAMCISLLRQHLTADAEENEYTLRCLFRVLCRTTNPEPATLECLFTSILNLIKRCAAQPNYPAFCHNLFECLGACIKSAASANLQASAEAAVIPVISVLVQQVNHEFTPYCFQIISMLLDATASASSLFSELLPHLLNPSLWVASQGNVPGLVRLLRGYYSKYALFEKLFVENMPQLLERVQYCLYHRRLYASGFELLNYIFVYIPLPAYEKHFKTLLTVILTRAHELKSAPYFTKELTQTLLLAECKLADSTVLLKALEEIQNGLSHQVICMIISPCIRNNVPSAMLTRKLYIIGLAKLASAIAVSMPNDRPMLEQVLLDLSQLIQDRDFSQEQTARSTRTPDNDLDADAEITESITNDLDFDVKYSKLAVASSMKNNDFVEEVKDIRAVIHTCLQYYVKDLQQLAGANAAYNPLLQLLS